MNDQNRLRRLSVILFFLMLIMLVAHMESLVRFNRREVQIQGGVTAAVRNGRSTRNGRRGPLRGL